MALINKLDPETVGRRLSEWLPTALPGATGVAVSDVHIPQSTGMSSESVLLEAEWTQDGERTRRGLVARVAPEGGGLFREYDLGREALVMSALAENTQVAAPRVVAHDTTGEVLGAPFLLMERAYGEVPADDPPFTMAGWVLDLPAERRRVLADSAVATLAGIATADWRALGLESLGRGGAGTPLEQELRWWEDFYHWTRGDKIHGTIESGWKWLHEHRPAEESPPVIVWGDARFGNLMFGPDQSVTGVFDWEMASLAPPEVDLGFFLFTIRVYTDGLGVPRPEGFPDDTEIVALYEQLSGIEVRDLDFYLAFAGVRTATLLMRVGLQLIELGAIPPDAPLPFANPASAALAALLGLEAPGGAAAWITGNR